MKTLNLIVVVTLAMVISFSSSVLAGGVDYVIGGSGWCYADAEDVIIEIAEVNFIEKYGVRKTINSIYVAKEYKTVIGPKGRNYNRISFNVSTIDISLPTYEGSKAVMLLYLVAAETDIGTYFLGDGKLIENKEDLKKYLDEFMESAEKYDIMEDMIKYIDS